jgi:hypothetical protein
MVDLLEPLGFVPGLDGREAASVLTRANGRIAFRGQARDVNLVLRQRERGRSMPFHLLVDGEPQSPGAFSDAILEHGGGLR